MAVRRCRSPSQASVAKYLVQRRQPPSQTWRTFLRNHVHQLVAADFVVVPTATGRLLFVVILLAHDRRRLVHVGVIDDGGRRALALSTIRRSRLTAGPPRRSARRAFRERRGLPIAVRRAAANCSRNRSFSRRSRSRSRSTRSRSRRNRSTSCRHGSAPDGGSDPTGRSARSLTRQLCQNRRVSTSQTR